VPYDIYACADVIQTYKYVRAALRWLAIEEGRNGKYLLLRLANERSGVAGTVDAIDNAIDCCQKGCYTSRFSLAQSFELMGHTKRLRLHSIP
jgi:hypothetical protein